LATAGTFLVTLPATSALAIGAPVHLADDTPQHYFLLDTAGNLGPDQGASGTGHFDGVWSKPDQIHVTPGTGTIAVLFQGSSLSMGADNSYARCYQVRPSTAMASRHLDAIRRAEDWIAGVE